MLGWPVGLTQPYPVPKKNVKNPAASYRRSRVCTHVYTSDTTIEYDRLDLSIDAHVDSMMDDCGTNGYSKAKVTALRPARGRSGQFDLELDGEPAGSVSQSVLEHFALAVGLELDAAQVQALLAAARVSGAMSLANAFLAHRPRAEAEVRQRLLRAGYDPRTIADTIDALNAQGLLNDQRFASLWLENRQSFNPRSSRLVALELRRKGLERGAIDDALQDAAIDDNVEALAAGRKRLHAFSTLDEQAFRRRLGGFLSRRGFGFEATERALNALWEELQLQD